MTLNNLPNMYNKNIMVVYLVTNKVNGKKYIGKDKNNNPKYIGSGADLKIAIKEYGKHNFKKEIIDNPKRYFKRQQSGQNGGNDDWMFSTNKKWQNFLKEPWVKSIEQW